MQIGRSARDTGKVRLNAYCFRPIESGLWTRVDFERFDLRLWGKYHHVILDVLQVSCDRLLFNSGRRIDCKDHIVCFRGDLCALVGAIQDARNDADLIAGSSYRRL